MNRTIKAMSALALCVVAAIFTSCSKDEKSSVLSQQEIEASIIGKWKRAATDGVTTLTNKVEIFTFFANGKGLHSISDYKKEEDVFVWANKSDMVYTITGNQIHQKSDIDRYFSIRSIIDNKMSVAVDSIISNGMDFKEDSCADFILVTADLSQDILGTWEGVAMTGFETYGNADACIEYCADGTYTYFRKENDKLVQSANTDNGYFVDGDWLAMRWRPESGKDFNCECWNIDYIRNDEMKWSAIREKEDGTRFTATFTWTRIK